MSPAGRTARLCVGMVQDFVFPPTPPCSSLCFFCVFFCVFVCLFVVEEGGGELHIVCEA